MEPHGIFAALKLPASRVLCHDRLNVRPTRCIRRTVSGGRRLQKSSAAKTGRFPVRIAIEMLVKAAGALLAAACFGTCHASSVDIEPASDAPGLRSTGTQLPAGFPSYSEALGGWRTPEDINAWIGARFEYDGERALRLSESQRATGQPAAIHAPSEFYIQPVGICVDLSRFAVETLRALAPELRPRYLMVEFTPALRAGQVLRRHWIASFERADGRYFFADSKYPGQIAGPYASVQSFITEYAAVRQREIVAFRELDSYRQRPKSQQQRKLGDA